MNFVPLLTTLFMISAAELGDKTQLLTLGFSARYSFSVVISAVALASACLMALAVILGGVINRLIPTYYLQLFAGMAFLGFGLWTLFGKEKIETSSASNPHPFWVVFSSFFIAELGDKTQLATLTLTAQYGAPFQIWLGATAGMIIINSIAAFAGSSIKRYIPDQFIKILGAIIFILFGISTLVGII
jgi:putative Ca2+/H+ antiporter (TMEM165/GDT1 family)